MKKIKLIFAAVFILVLSEGANAQSPTPDYFAGKWTVIVEGTPGGDSKMIVDLARQDGKLEGVVRDSMQVEISKISRVEETEKSLTLYFTAQGYDVNLVMDKKDGDHTTGNMMGMFDAKGERIKLFK
ncbi:MAG: hypothetical protein V4725_02240 [Bacteroidota bacterium]